MAKEIPFFKFFVGEWANGDITAESYKTQGVFINICSVYWTKEGELSEVFLRKKIKANKEISLLIDSEIIKVENKNIVISFLDEQLSECEGIRVKNSEAGKKSARQRALNKRSTSVQPKLNEEPTESQPLREDKEKKREDKIREEGENIIIPSSLDSLNKSIGDKKTINNYDYKQIITSSSNQGKLRNLFVDIKHNYNGWEDVQIHGHLDQAMNNYATHYRIKKLNIIDDRHLMNSFVLFAKKHWGKNDTNIRNLK